MKQYNDTPSICGAGIDWDWYPNSEDETSEQ